MNAKQLVLSPDIEKKKEPIVPSESSSESDFYYCCKLYQSSLSMKGEDEIQCLLKSVTLGKTYLRQQTEIQKKRKITMHLLLVYQRLYLLKEEPYGALLADTIYDALKLDIKDPAIFLLGAELFYTRVRHLKEASSDGSLKKSALLLLGAKTRCTKGYKKKNPDFLQKIESLNQKITKEVLLSSKSE